MPPLSVQKLWSESQPRKTPSLRGRTTHRRVEQKNNPQRYRLSSGAELLHHFIPNHLYPNIHIWTKVGNEEYDVSKYIKSRNGVWRSFEQGEFTVYELINEVFEPWEQVSEIQARLLGAAFELASGGAAQPHVSTGGGTSTSELPWRDKDKYHKKQTTIKRH